MTARPLVSKRLPARAKRGAGGAARVPRERGADDIHERIAVAILEHRLHPGTKLGEERLAEIFGVSRARIREVLARLAHERIVELYPQRGAYVAQPSIEQARDVFEARRLIEPAVLRRLIATLTPRRVTDLRRHLELEFEARRRNDRRAMIRLSGEFHVMAAELAGNSALARAMRELCLLTCLAISLHEGPTASSCRSDEHQRIVEAIAAGDGRRAERLMLEHLAHIEGSLEPRGPAQEEDLEAVFRKRRAA